MMKLIKRLLQFFKITYSKTIEQEKLKSYDFIFLKTDAIGDMYILLNLFKELNFSPYFKKYKILIICSEVVKDITAHHLTDVDLLAINLKKFEIDLTYQNSIITMLSSVEATNLISLLPSRDWASDIISYALKAKTKMAFDGDLSKQSLLFNLFSRTFYNILFIHNNFTSEYLKLKYLLISAFNIAELRSQLPLPSEKINNKTVVIFPGSSWSGKNWPIEFFLYLTTKILEISNHKIILCGGSDDKVLAEKLAALDSSRIRNAVGLTTLIELDQMIANSDLVITNDTSAAHVARFYNVRSVVFVGGGHGDRFLPYGSLIDSSSTVMRHPMPCYGCNWKCKYDPENGAVPCIARISQEEAWQVVKMNLA